MERTKNLLFLFFVMFLGCVTFVEKRNYLRTHQPKFIAVFPCFSDIEYTRKGGKSWRITSQDLEISEDLYNRLSELTQNFSFLSPRECVGKYSIADFPREIKEAFNLRENNIFGQQNDLREVLMKITDKSKLNDAEKNLILCLGKQLLCDAIILEKLEYTLPYHGQLKYDNLYYTISFIDIKTGEVIYNRTTEFSESGGIFPYGFLNLGGPETLEEAIEKTTKFGNENFVSFLIKALDS
jgi:hypothetical protein